MIATRVAPALHYAFTHSKPCPLYAALRVLRCENASYVLKSGGRSNMFAVVEAVYSMDDTVSPLE
jgi:7-keto-8-aminopelargonate synthetase-like enzyme